MVKRLRHHPFTVVTGVRFPLESPKYGRCTRPYFFWESSPCYAYCFAIRDRLHARVSRHYRALPFPNLGACCKTSCLRQFFRIDPFCESCSTVPCYVRLDFPRRKEYNCQSRPVVKFSLFCLTYLEHCIIITIASEPPDR